MYVCVYVTMPIHVAHGHKILYMHGFPVQRTYGKKIQSAN